MDKWFDQITDSRGFMKLVALVLALLLFGSVYDGSKETNDINIPGKNETEAISGIPVKIYYDTDNLVVTGVPETVEVTLEGPTPSLQAAKTQKDFEVFADLSKVEVGEQRVKLQIKDLSDKLRATINPVYVEVNVQEKVSKDFNIEAEFNHKLVMDDYEAGTPVVNPNKVKITGGKDVMDRISYVKAMVEITKPFNETVEQSATITVLDQNLNKLNVTIEQESVKVTIPVKRASKTVPINIVKEGTAPTGVTIDSITLDTNQAKITGTEDILNSTENVRVEVDVSAISESTELTLPVIISDGIKEVNPKTVKATIKVSVTIEEAATTEKEASKTFTNLPITFNGLSEEYNATFLEPASGETNVTITGTDESLASIKESDFQLSVNVADLPAGEHKVKINVNSPESVKWILANETASISITSETFS